MKANAKIYVAGTDLSLGKAIIRRLRELGYGNIVPLTEEEKPKLTNAEEVERFFLRELPEYVFVVAGKSGGITANQKYPADLMLDNLLVGSHIIECARRHQVRKLLYVASSCVYPKHCIQPMKVESLMTGPLEPTNEAYAIAKLTGTYLCQAYRQQYGANFVSVIPANPFGPGDNFDSEDSHVVPALIRRMHEAKLMGAPSVEIWGSGAPQREFIFIDDLADACIFVMRKYEDTVPINIGSGATLSIKELAALIKEITNYLGVLHFNPNKPDGMPLKVLESSALKKMGWRPRTSLRAGLETTYRWFQDTQQGEIHAHGTSQKR